MLKKIPAGQIIALVRNETKATRLKDAGIIIRAGDYHNPASLAAAFANVDKAVLISSNDFNDRLGQHKNVIDAAKAQGVSHLTYTGILFPAGEGRIPFALRDGMGEANANVLTGNGHENKIYNIASDAAYSFQDMADMLTDLSGRKITYTNPDHASYLDSLRAAGIPEHMTAIAAGFSTAMHNGDFELPSEELKDLLGRKPVDLKTYLQQTYLAADRF